jgi:hypothetical protein
MPGAYRPLGLLRQNASNKLARMKNEKLQHLFIAAVVHSSLTESSTGLVVLVALGSALLVGALLRLLFLVVKLLGFF